MAALLIIRSHRNRFLPMAVPIGVLAALLTMVCTLQLLVHLNIGIQFTLPNWAQGLRFCLSFFILPFWIQVINEYKNGKTQPIRSGSWFYIEPVMTVCVVAYNVSVSTESFKTATDMLGVYRPFHFYYMLTLATAVLAWSVFNVSKKTQRNVYSLMQFGACLAIPMLLFFAFRFEVISKPLGASALVLLLVWAAKESDLLNVIPSAMSGVLKQIDAGVMVFNAQHQLVYHNLFAEELLLISSHNASSIKTTTQITHIDGLPNEIRSAFDFDSQQTQSALVQIPTISRLNSQTETKKDIKESLNNEPENDGETCYLDASLTTIQNDKTKQNLGSILVLKDVSKRINSELKLAKSNKQLEQLDRQKSDFFAGISHEFRTPLTLSIGALTDALNGDYGTMPKKLNPVLNEAKENNQHLLRLVSQLLELSRLNEVQLNQGNAFFDPQKLSLKQLIKRTLANFESLGSKHTIKVDLRDNSSTDQLWFDTNSLEKVLMNLISNAFKSIQDNGQIDITLTDNQTSIKLSVKDSGHGISEDVLPNIFKAFYYHDTPHPNWPTGTGIGLYVTKQILDTHGANISVSSVEHQGTEFVIKFIKGREHLSSLISQPTTTQTISNIDESSQLNIASSDTINTNELTNKISNKTSNKIGEPTKNELETSNDKSFNSNTEKLVLVVEDNVQMRRYIRHHLAQEFRLIEAEDGEEGFALAQQSVPDLILSDLMMPKVSGLQLSRKIRSHAATSHIPIILLTAKNERKDKLDGFKLGIDDYITKPFEASELIARIHNLITSREVLRQHFSRTVDSSQALLEQTYTPLIEQEASFLTQLNAYLTAHLDNSDLLIKDIAAEFNMSERSFHRKLNALTGASPKQYIIKYRMEAACKLLVDTDKAISYIALTTGFGGSTQFSRAFKHQYQVSPSEYREQFQIPSTLN